MESSAQEHEMRAREQSYVVKWLNYEVKLSRSVGVLEHEMSNGFLIGELLHRHNVLTDDYFHRLVDDSAPETKAANFSRLEPLLDTLHLRVGPRGLTYLLRQIVTEQRGAVAKLLFQLKLKLSRTAGKDMEWAPQSAEQQMKATQRLAQPWETLGAKPALHSVHADLASSDTSANNKGMAVHLRKFEAFQIATEKAAIEAGQELHREKIRMVGETRGSALHGTSAKSQFFSQWMDQGKANWKTNQKVKVWEVAVRQPCWKQWESNGGMALGGEVQWGLKRVEGRLDRSVGRAGCGMRGREPDQIR